MPKLFLIRHAIAEDRVTFRETGRPDNQRPLTDSGRKKMKKISKKLYSLEPVIDILCQSPLLRSQQTVEILKEDYKKAKIKTLSPLEPGSSYHDLLQNLRTFKKQTVALVGHEDHLSQFLCFLLTGVASPTPFYFKKGGVACLTYKEFEPQSFELLWLATPRMWIY